MYPIQLKGHNPNIFFQPLGWCGRQWRHFNPRLQNHSLNLLRVARCTLLIAPIILAVAFALLGCLFTWERVGKTFAVIRVSPELNQRLQDLGVRPLRTSFAPSFETAFPGLPNSAEVKDEEGPSYYFRYLRLFIKDRVWPIGRLRRAFAGTERHESLQWKELLDWILKDKPSENQGGKIESLVKSLAKIEVALSRQTPPPPVLDRLFLRITAREGVTIG